MNKCHCNCTNCNAECYPRDEGSLKKWRKDFDNLRQQWSDFNLCSSCSAKEKKCCQCSTNQSHLVKGRFGLAWVIETPKKKVCKPCGWQLEICDTLSSVECKCKKMEEWAKCPPINECCCKPKKKTNNITKPCCCGRAKTKPCPCTQQTCDCQRGGRSSFDKAVETDNIENNLKNTVDQDNPNDEEVIGVDDLSQNLPTPAEPSNRSRARRRRR